MKINEDLDNKAKEAETMSDDTTVSKSKIKSSAITGGIVAVAVAVIGYLYLTIPASINTPLCISVNGGGQTTDLVVQGKGNTVGTVFFEYDGGGNLSVAITENTGKELNNAGVAFDKSLDNLLKKYANGNNIVDGKVKDANKECITSSRAGEVVFTFKDAVFKSGETYYFIVYCNQGWGAGQAFGLSGLNGNNGFVIPVYFYDCVGKNCKDTITVSAIAEIEEIVPLECRESVTTLIITGTDTADFVGIKYIGGTGKTLPNLENVVLENFAGKIPDFLFAIPVANYMGPGNAEYSNNWLKSFNAPMATNIGAYAFPHCSFLVSVLLPNIISIDSFAFLWCRSLENLSFPNATDIGDRAFFDCRRLVTISLPEVINVGNGAFWRCYALENISFPSAINVGAGAFASCRQLMSVSLPNATYIGKPYSSYDAYDRGAGGVFSNCEQLTSVSLPNATFIGYSAFSHCCNLTELTMGSATTDAITWDKLGTINDIMGTKVVTDVPSGQVILYLGAKTFERDFPKKTSPLQNQLYQEYTFKEIHKISSDDDIPLFSVRDLEIPEVKPGEEIVSHTAYSLVYNENHEQANWVAYMLCRERTKKEVARKDNFRVDPKIKTGSATLADYKNSGYDRGHLVPCNDMTWSFVTMDESFFMSNMSPHHPNFHQAGGIWYKLEDLVQKWAVEYDTLYIVVGPALQQETSGNIGPNKVSIPKYYYKVILNYTSNRIEGIGFIMPHEHTKSGKPVRDFAVSIDSVQRFTGINFYHNIPDKKLEDSIERKLCIDCWRW